MDYNNVVFTMNNNIVNASFDIQYEDKNEQIMFDIMYLIEDIGADMNNYVNGYPVRMTLVPNSVHIIREPVDPPM